MIVHPRPLPPPRADLRRVTTPRRGCVVHCPGSLPAVPDPATLDEALELIRRVDDWHAARGWGDVGYHRAVWREHVFELRALEAAGAHAGPGRWPHSGRKRSSFNRSHFGILILHPAEAPVHPCTLATTVAVCDELVPGGEIVPHRSLTKKAGPGAAFAAALPRDRNPYVDPRTGRRNR